MRICIFQSTVYVYLNICMYKNIYICIFAYMHLNLSVSILIKV